TLPRTMLHWGFSNQPELHPDSVHSARRFLYWWEHLHPESGFQTEEISMLLEAQINPVLLRTPPRLTWHSSEKPEHESGVPKAQGHIDPAREDAERHSRSASVRLLTGPLHSHPGAAKD